MLTIEKNIPIPSSHTSRSTKSIFWEMEIGDSVFVKQMKSVGGLYSYTAKKTGRKFTQRRESDGVRVWRVA